LKKHKKVVIIVSVVILVVTFSLTVALVCFASLDIQSVIYYIYYLYNILINKFIYLFNVTFRWH